MLTAPHQAGARRWLFVATILVGSFLLFLIQPMVARMALPRLGGAPAVWNSAMLVYQALLLGGYAYAHALGALAGRRQAAVHLLLFLVCALWLPLGLADRVPSAAAAPELWVPWLLILSIGPIFFVVAAQAPLMQRWYSIASGGGDPYALYAASNLGSFGGLLAYPLLVEPVLPVAGQRLLWTIGYVLLALLVAGCALLLPKGAAGPTVVRPTSPPPSLGRWLHWVLLAAVPSGLMLSTTTHLTTDIVAVPLLWVIPLGLYLLSFSLAFAAWRRPADIIGRVAPVALLALAGPIFGAGSSWPLLAAGLGLLLLFVIAVALHGELHRLRPAPDRLTGFYLAMAIGGVIGGLFPALVAPALFDWTWEHVLLIFAAGLLVPLAFPVQWVRRLWGDDRRAWLLTLGVVLVLALILLVVIRRLPPLGADREIIGYAAILAIGLLCLGRRLAFAAALAAMLMLLGGYDQLMTTLKGDQRTRSYYGIYTIYDWPGGGMRLLSHGTTFHGLQLTTKGDETEPTSYYERNSGVGQAMLLAPSLYGPGARIGVVGLGTGTLACYARPGQRWTFYEIDPTVVAIARDPAKFSFLQRCLPDVSIRVGDARLSLEHAQPASLDLLVLDAFSSDSVPMHLLTREAFAAYGRALDRRGLLLVHISNRFLDLEPVVAAAVRNGGWRAAMLSRFNYSKDRRETLVHGSSVWIALTRDPAVLARLTAGTPDWTVLTPRPGFDGWTDDFSSILPLVKAWAPDTQEKP